MSKLSEIYEGWKNVVFPTTEIEALAKERALVCAECKSLVLGVCTKCCCPHVGKTHSPESRCPENKWQDGWGNQNNSEPLQVDELEIVIPPVYYWDEETQSFVSGS